MAEAPRLSIITDWRIRDADLPDLDPGHDLERSIVPQKFVVLHRIVTWDVQLTRLKIGPVVVAFELTQLEGAVQHYRPTIDPQVIARLLPAAAAAGPNAIAMAAALEVSLRLRNNTTAPVKPRAALLVQEEA